MQGARNPESGVATNKERLCHAAETVRRPDNAADGRFSTACQGVKSGYDDHPGALFQSCLSRGRCTLPGVRPHLLPGMHQRARRSDHLRFLSETCQHKGCQTIPPCSCHVVRPGPLRHVGALVILLSARQGFTHHPILLP